LPYGIANRTGQVTLAQAGEILAYARSCGVDTVDTAVAYGDSERRLGELGVRDWRVISKLPSMPNACNDVTAWVEECVRASLERLALQRLYGLLLHRPRQLLEEQGQELYAALLRLKRRGVVEQIGVSIYSPNDLDVLWPRFELDLVQAPFNVFDRRVAESGWLKRLRDSGAEVHTRSVFLQGLLLAADADRPAKFRAWQPLWNAWRRWLTEQGVSALEACLAFVLSHTEIDRVIVGVDSLAQLRQILAHAGSAAPMAPIALSCADLELIDPSIWGNV
jgi:aryl-alcohol dehydrogenase-like predicted oxidoreductase